MTLTILVVRLFGVLVVTLGLGKPGQESLGGFANLLAYGEVHVLLASLGAPGAQDFLAEDILVVKNHEDLRGLIKDLRVLFATKSNETLNTSKEGLFMLLGSNHLHHN